MGSTAGGRSVRDRLRGALSPAAKERIANLICHPAVGKALGLGLGDRIPSGPFSIVTSSAAVSPRSKAQIFWGIYESAEIRLIRRHLRGDLDLLEVGSSLGVVSVHAIDRLARDARVVCVEANPDLLPVLRANIESNHPSREVTILNRAIDYVNAPRTTAFELSENTTGSRLGRFGRPDAGGGRRVEVPASTLRTLVRETGLRDFALISDIEGAEAGFIYADPEELAGCRQILIELHDTEHEGVKIRREDLLQELQSRHGFRVVDGHGSVFTLER